MRALVLSLWGQPSSLFCRSVKVEHKGYVTLTQGHLRGLEQHRQDRSLRQQRGTIL